MSLACVRPAAPILLARVERENPGWMVQMEHLSWQGGCEKITAAVAAGGVPDLCEVW